MVMAGHPKQKFVAYPMSAWHAAKGSSLVNWIAELWYDPVQGFAREDWNKRRRQAGLPAAVRVMEV